MEISPKSEEFKKAREDLDVLTSQILERALQVTEVKEKSLARILHDVSGFKEVFICARVHSLSWADLGFVSVCCCCCVFYLFAVLLMCVCLFVCCFVVVVPVWLTGLKAPTNNCFVYFVSISIVLELLCSMCVQFNLMTCI